MPPSFFNFHFRLLPWELCLNLNFQGVQLAEDVGAVCTRDHLGLFVAAEPANFDALGSTAEQLARALVQSHAYCSYPAGGVLDVEPTTWLEVRDCEAKPTVTGYMHPSLRTAALLPGHSDNTPLIAAADLVRDVGHNVSLRLALADFHAARRERGLYYAFYAYRTLEDVGYIFGVKDEHPDWGAMNTAFGTTKATWGALVDAGTKAAPLEARGPGSPRIAAA
jgi:hypothetical protein